jgi:RNA polymerase sigma-70 factor, ECF subfamily
MRALAVSDGGIARQEDRHRRTAERLTALYEAYAADAFRYALHLTGRREDAEDVVQHVFLQAYATLEAGRDLASPRAWLVKATKHRSLNLVRDRHDAPVGDVESPARDADPDAEAEALAEVRAVLWSLPQPQHHAFVLRHWSGLSQDEIAEVLATTPHAVESLLVRARTALVAEREAGDPECAGIRRRLARMREPTPAQAAHVTECRRCRTAQMRLLRASGHAAAFALVPGPRVLHTLAAAVPGFGASGTVAGVVATGSAAGTGSGGAAVSAASAATKAGIVTKLAVAATAAAVAVTAVHPLRSAVTHTILHHAPAPSVATASTRPAAQTGDAPYAAPIRARSTASGNVGEKAGHGRGRSHPHAARGKSGVHGSHGNGNGKGSGRSAAHGQSESAPGHTKAPGSHAAAGRGAAKPHGSKGRSHSHAGNPSHSHGRHTGKG